MPLKKLSELVKGERGVLARINSGKCSVNFRLMEMGMVEGCEVEMLRQAPFNGPLHLTVCQTELCLSKEEAENFLVHIENLTKGDA